MHQHEISERLSAIEGTQKEQSVAIGRLSESVDRLVLAWAGPIDGSTPGAAEKARERDKRLASHDATLEDHEVRITKVEGRPRRIVAKQAGAAGGIGAFLAFVADKLIDRFTS